VFVGSSFDRTRTVQAACHSHDSHHGTVPVLITYRVYLHEEERVRSLVLEPATRGTINVLRSCVRAGNVRRVVFTSSVSTLSAAAPTTSGAEAAVVDESCLRDLDDVWATKPIGWVRGNATGPSTACTFPPSSPAHLL
jgi:hypothetical protein